MTARLVKSLLLALLLLPAAGHAQTMRNMTFESHRDDFPGAGFVYSACWSYIHPDGREYAVLGTRNGTAIYNVTIPSSTYLVAFIPGKPSVWREMKSYQTWIYVVTEEYGADPLVTPGLQIIRMTNPESPVLAATYDIGFQTSHTVSIDAVRGILVCNGTRSWSSCGAGCWAGTATGMRFLSLANPEAPVEIGRWPSGPAQGMDYVHDSVPIGTNRLYASSITIPGFQRIFDFTNPANPIQLHSWTYNGAFTHNAWPNASGSHLYVTDEINGQPLKIFDITNVTAPVQVNAITSNPQAIVHNAHVMGNELYLSNYTEGIRILDLTDPAHPAEFAWADSWAGPSGGFHSIWAVCPFFPSGTVIASDIETGLYVYRPVRNYGLLRVRVVAQGTLAPIPEAKVVLTSQGDSLTTTADGIVQFAPNPGMHTIQVRKFSYLAAPVGRAIPLGGQEEVVIEIPAVDLTGTVREAGSLAALQEAEVELDQPAFDLTDSQGAFAMVGVPEGTYTIRARSPGHVSAAYQSASVSAADPTVDFRLRAASTWDPLESPGGWMIGAPGDGATSGIWILADPLGTGSIPSRAREAGGATARRPSDVPRPAHPDHGDLEHPHLPGSVQPESDRTPPPGTMCFVTGQGTNPFSTGEADLDGGPTTLSSPPLDMTGMGEPTIGYWRWFYGTVAPDDWLQVQISSDGGTNWVLVETTTGIVNRWTERTIRVADFVPPTNQVRVRFVAADLGGQSLVEAAIDDLVTYDAALAPVDVPPLRPELSLGPPRPNPSSGMLRFTVELPSRELGEVEVLDLAGRRVRILHRGAAAAGQHVLQWDGSDGNGQKVSAGLYFLRARFGNQQVRARIVRLD